MHWLRMVSSPRVSQHKRNKKSRRFTTTAPINLDNRGVIDDEEDNDKSATGAAVFKASEEHLKVAPGSVRYHKFWMFPCYCCKTHILLRVWQDKIILLLLQHVFLLKVIRRRRRPRTSWTIPSSSISSEVVFNNQGKPTRGQKRSSLTTVLSTLQAPL